MRILFDQGTPLPLRKCLDDHDVTTAYEAGWATMSNGELLDIAEGAFDLLVTTDKRLRHQQKIGHRNLAILVVPTTSWPEIHAKGKSVRKLKRMSRSRSSE